MTLELTTEEAMLVRDAITNTKHELKHSPSERGQRLSSMAADIAEQLNDRIRLTANPKQERS